ncbi:hypothetical protein Tco_1314019 [Tanacetum coccineum]
MMDPATTTTNTQQKPSSGSLYLTDTPGVAVQRTLENALRVIADEKAKTLKDLNGSTDEAMALAKELMVKLASLDAEVNANVMQEQILPGNASLNALSYQDSQKKQLITESRKAAGELVRVLNEIKIHEYSIQRW